MWFVKYTRELFFFFLAILVHSFLLKTHNIRTISTHLTTIYAECKCQVVSDYIH